jgi:DNA-binding MarR family transcriptional regulator
MTIKQLVVPLSTPTIYQKIVNDLQAKGAFSKKQKRSTRQIATAIGEPQGTTREALKELEKNGVVKRDPSTTSPRPIVVRHTQTATSLHKTSQYQSDANYVTRLAQNNPNVVSIPRGISLSQLNMRNPNERQTYNDIVKALRNAGLNGNLATYDLVGGTYYWWLTPPWRKNFRLFTKQRSTTKKTRKLRRKKKQRSAS